MPVMMIVFSIVYIIAIGIYLYFFLIRACQFWSRNHAFFQNKYSKMYVGSVALCVAVCSANLFGTATLIVLHIVIFALLMDIVTFIVRFILSKIHVKPDLWNKIYRCGLVPVLITAMLIGYGYYNMGKIRETDYTIYTNKDISENGYRVLMISDLHFGNAIDAEKLKQYCTKMNELHLDFVVLCGDIIDEHTERSEMQESLRLLSGIKNKYGIFYVFGNHDMSKYSASPNFTEKQLRDTLLQNHINVLEDSIATVNGEITIVGRKDYSNIRNNTEELLRSADRNTFILMLDHQPVEYEQNQKYGVDLQLSGHTHNGQIWPVGLLIEPLGFSDSAYGYTKKGDFQAIVGSGISGWGYPIRTQGHSEYVVINIQPKFK